MGDCARMTLRLAQTNLNAGELSPKLEGRIDIGKYGVGLKQCENFIPLVQGPVAGRAGTRFVAEIKDSDSQAWLIPFQFSATDAWVIEIGDQYIRFYTDRGQVLDGVAAQEIASPYILDDLFDADGKFVLNYAQSGDVVYLVHRNYAPRKLMRRSASVWELVEIDFQPHPFKDINADQAIQVSVSAETGSITISANAPVFDSGQIGNLFYIEQAPESSYTPWEAGKSITTGDERRSDGNVYKATSTGTTSGVKPTHTEGIKTDGGVSWEYLHSGYGWAEITAVASSVSASAEVVKRYPSSLAVSIAAPSTVSRTITGWELKKGRFIVTTSVDHGFTTEKNVDITGMPATFSISAPNGLGGTISKNVDVTANGTFEIVVESNNTFSYVPLNVPSSVSNVYTGSGSVTAAAVMYNDGTPVASASYKWAKAAWNSSDGFPTHVTFFRERLTYARGNRMWMSVSGDYENFSKKDGDTVTADMSVDIQLVATEVNNTQWITPSSQLIVGTVGAEFMVGEMSAADPFGPDNVKAAPQGNYGSASLPGIRVGDSVLFVQRAGRKVREIKYAFESDSYVSTDMTILADHITKTGISSWTFAQDPDSILWAARADGMLVSFTFNREQDVIGWSRHPLGGDGFVECVTSITSPAGDQDDVWMIVRRTINGVTKRYVEVLTERYEEGGDIADYLYLDCGATYDGSPATTISGLGHLEGETVSVLADGSTHPNRVVTGGEIELQRASSVVQIGLPYSRVLKTMRIEGGTQAGTAQGKNKRITSVTFRFIDTLGAKAGPSEDKMDTIQFRRGSYPMDSAPPVFSGDKKIPWPNGYDTDGYIMLKQDQPLPITVVAIMPDMTTYN